MNLRQVANKKQKQKRLNQKKSNLNRLKRLQN